MIPSYHLALLVRHQRILDLRQEAFQARLARAGKQSSIQNTQRRLLCWLGTMLLHAGCLLQQRRPALAPAEEGYCL
jgi:hypothetical protein